MPFNFYVDHGLTLSRSKTYIAAQMYAGGNLLVGRRKVSDYNAFVSDQANALKDSECFPILLHWILC